MKPSALKALLRSQGGTDSSLVEKEEIVAEILKLQGSAE